MKRRLLNLVTLASLLACLGAAAASARSNFAADHLHWRSDRAWADFISARGRFLYWRMDAADGAPFATPDGAGFEHRRRPPHNNPGQRLPPEVFAHYRYDPATLGFEYHRAGQPGLTLTYVGMPWWPLMLASAVLPLRWYVVRSKARRASGPGRENGGGGEAFAADAARPSSGAGGPADTTGAHASF